MNRRQRPRFGNYHPSGYTPRRQWTQQERLDDLLKIADLIERGAARPDDLARVRQHVDALRQHDSERVEASDEGDPELRKLVRHYEPPTEPEDPEYGLWS